MYKCHSVILDSFIVFVDKIILPIFSRGKIVFNSIGIMGLICEGQFEAFNKKALPCAHRTQQKEAGKWNI